MLSRELGRHWGSLQLPPPFQPLLPCQPMWRAGLLQAREEVTCSARASSAGRAHCCCPAVLSAPLVCLVSPSQKPLYSNSAFWIPLDFKELQCNSLLLQLLKAWVWEPQKIKKGGEEKKAQDRNCHCFYVFIQFLKICGPKKDNFV